MEIFIPNPNCPPPTHPQPHPQPLPRRRRRRPPPLRSAIALPCKSIPLRRLLTRSAVADVRREIQIMHHLTGHLNIVELRAAYDDRSAVHLVMEVYEGGELLERIIERKFYLEKRAAGICREIVTVVRSCHCFEVMHRYLKPENFLFLSKEEENFVEGDGLWAVHLL